MWRHCVPMTESISLLQRILARRCRHGVRLLTTAYPSPSSLSSPPCALLTCSKLMPLNDHLPPLSLPGTRNSPLIYTFPTLNATPQLAPSAIPLCDVLEKLAPPVASQPAVIELPAISQPPKLALRILQIRRHKMKKHKRLQRYKRDFFKYQAYHRAKKAKAEDAFRERMRLILGELETFDPEQYVKDTIKRARREWRSELAPSGRVLHPHWSTVMSIEELYGIDEDDYIDKRYGIPDQEDADRIDKLKDEFARRFRIDKGNEEKNKGDK